MNNVLLFDVYIINKVSIREYFYKIISYFYRNNLILVDFYINICIKMMEDFLINYEIYVSCKKRRIKLTVISLSCIMIVQKFCDDNYKISIKEISKISNIDYRKIVKYENKILRILDYNVFSYIK
jgi:hypothetical protein